MKILSFDLEFTLKSFVLPFLSSSLMISKVLRGVGWEWGGSGVKEMKENGLKMGFKHSNPDFYYSWTVLVFSKITVLPLKSSI